MIRMSAEQVEVVANVARDQQEYYTTVINDDPSTLAYWQGVEAALRWLQGNAVTVIDNALA